MIGNCQNGRFSGGHELAKVITGVKFRNGIEEVEIAGPDNQPARIAA